MLDCRKEWRCCTDQKTEYRTAQAAMRVTEVFIVELMKKEKKYSVIVDIEVIDKYLALASWRVQGIAESVELTTDGESPLLVALLH